MANTVTKTTLVDGPRNLVVLVNIRSDGASGELSQILINRSDYAPTDGTELVVERLEGVCSGFVTTLSFDANTDLVFAQFPDGDWFQHNWNECGGVSSNKAGTGANGDILIATSGFTVTTDVGTFTMFMRKA